MEDITKNPDRLLLDKPPNFPEIYRQFMAQFEADVSSAIRDAQDTGDVDDLEPLRSAITCLGIAVQSIRTHEQFEDLCRRLGEQSIRLALADEDDEGDQ